MDECQHLKVRISFESDEELMKEASGIIPMVRPEWQSKQHQFKFFSEGITNKLVGVHVGDDMILIRVYGNKTEMFVDRQAEIRIRDFAAFCVQLKEVRCFYAFIWGFKWLNRSTSDENRT